MVEPLVNGHVVHPPFVGDSRPPSGNSAILLLCGLITTDSTVKEQVQKDKEGLPPQRSSPVNGFGNSCKFKAF